MAYSDFTLQDIRNKLGVKEKREYLFKEIKPQKISPWLEKTLSLTKSIPSKSEKAKSELIVTPILIELRERNDNFFTFYSGESLDADREKGLIGECDFILTKDTGAFGIDLPILSLVEAKRNDMELGIIQCGAQMIGAEFFNKKNNHPTSVIYGCVTTADSWQFLKLENNVLKIDKERYYLSDIELIIGAFQEIIDFYKKNI